MCAFEVEAAVRQRYSVAARQKVQALCCPIQYDPQLLKVIPPEILERDYGCGDPSRWLRPGEIVLDLGSGAGKICFIASQIVGARGRVIGLDMNDEMLALARRHEPAVGAALGWRNVQFRKARIQDLALDLERLDAELKARPIQGADAFLQAEALAERLRVSEPLVADDSVDVVISNCVLNLVEPRAKARLLAELFRVLKDQGRAVISDIVSDQAVPMELQRDPTLWSGCISGAFTEEGFLQAFAEAGFHGIRILELAAAPWRTIGEVEFRSITIEAWKSKPESAGEGRHPVIYRGPFRQVVDDEDRQFVRGRRHEVDGNTRRLLREGPYAEHFEFVELEAGRMPGEAAPAGFEGVKPLDPMTTSGQGSCCPGDGCC